MPSRYWQKLFNLVKLPLGNHGYLHLNRLLLRTILSRRRYPFLFKCQKLVSADPSWKFAGNFMEFIEMTLCDSIPENCALICSCSIWMCSQLSIPYELLLHVYRQKMAVLVPTHRRHNMPVALWKYLILTCLAGDASKELLQNTIDSL